VMYDLKPLGTIRIFEHCVRKLMCALVSPIFLTVLLILPIIPLQDINERIKVRTENNASDLIMSIIMAKL